MAKLPNYDEALGEMLRAVGALPEVTLPLAEAMGLTLTQPVTADRDQPPFHRSAMDGFALRSQDANATRPIVGETPAGSVWTQTLAPGEAVRIATGAPVPEGADAVLPIERAAVTGEQVMPTEPVRAWQNVHRRGSDCVRGDTIIPAGTVLMPHHLGLAAAVGATQLTVRERPRVAVITSGDEIVPGDATPLPHQVRNSNGPMVTALARQFSATVIRTLHVRDETADTIEAAKLALADSDVIVTTGGVSVGQRDRFVGLWEQLGGRIVLHGVAIQPGKPILMAQVPLSTRSVVVLGLPGNPVSVLCTAWLFLEPMIARLMGREPRRWRTVTLTQPVRAKASRQMFRAARRVDDAAVEVLPWQGSGDLVHTSGADGFVRLPLIEGEVRAGERVPFLEWER